MSDTEEIFRHDAYQADCQARVVAWSEEPGGVILDRTVFYPQGGGQPGDIGVLAPDGLEPVVVVDTRYDAQGRIVHVVADPALRPAPGVAVGARIDWPRRHRLMRIHTCLHLISRLADGKITGAGVGDGKGRIDMDLPGAPPDRVVLQERLDQAIKADAPVVVRWISDAELDASPDLVRTLAVAPPRGTGKVRIVEIVGVDVQPCGGTHVRSLAEIGDVRIGKVESKGKQNRRINVSLGEASGG